MEKTMNNKEQIIVNGVDVSGCEYACNTAFGRNGCKHPAMKNILCYKNPNCYFKQLSRKTQECEELKEQLQANQPTGICETCMAKAILQNDKYRKALEKIEEVWAKDEDGDYDFVKWQILNIINEVKGKE